MRTKKTPISHSEPAPPPRAVGPKELHPAPSKPPPKRAAKRPIRPVATGGGAARPRARPAVAIVSEAQLLRVEPGLYNLTIGSPRGSELEIAGMTLPAVFVATPHGDAIELIGVRGGGAGIDAVGGTVTMRAPAAGGHVLVTSYSPPGEAAMSIDIELRPVDAVPETLTASGVPALRTEIVLHIEREGDCQFTTGGWAGRLGSRRRIEALAVRPLEGISRGEVEYKVYGAGGRETPWVSDGRLCGTRGQGLPLTGFAIRLAPHLRGRFDVIYRGAFFASGPASAALNGEACFASLRDDPLEAVEIRK